MQTNLFRPIELDQPTNLELVGRLIHSLQTNLFSSGHAQTNQRMELVGQTHQPSELVGPRHMVCVIPGRWPSRSWSKANGTGQGSAAGEEESNPCVSPRPMS